MAGLGTPELILLLVVALLIFGGYKKLPDASRSLGRSLRIFKGEMKGMKSDDLPEGVHAKDPATTTPVRGEIASSASDDLTADLEADAREAEARAAEARAAELRARADRARSGSADGPR